MIGMSIRSQLRSRGFDDGPAGVDRVELHVSELIGPETPVSEALVTEWNTTSAGLRGEMTAAEGELRILAQSYGDPVLGPPGLVIVTGLSVVADGFGVLRVLRDIWPSDSTRIIQAVLLLSWLVVVTAAGWHFVMKAWELPARRNRLVSAGLAGAWLATLSVIAVFRYYGLAAVGVSLAASYALVGLSLVMSAGPALISAWSLWLLGLRYPTWKQLRKARSIIAKLTVGISGVEKTRTAEFAKAAGRTSDREQAAASYHIGFHKSTAQRQPRHGEPAMERGTS